MLAVPSAIQLSHLMLGKHMEAYETALPVFAAEQVGAEVKLSADFTAHRGHVSANPPRPGIRQPYKPTLAAWSHRHACVEAGGRDSICQIDRDAS